MTVTLPLLVTLSLSLTLSTMFITYTPYGVMLMLMTMSYSGEIQSLDYGYECQAEERSAQEESVASWTTTAAWLPGGSQSQCRS